PIEYGEIGAEIGLARLLPLEIRVAELRAGESRLSVVRRRRRQRATGKIANALIASGANARAQLERRVLREAAGECFVRHRPAGRESGEDSVAVRRAESR